MVQSRQTCLDGASGTGPLAITRATKVRYRFLIITSAALLLTQPLRAQLMLPGAIQAPPATAPKTPPGPASKKLKPLGLKAPSEETVLGRELSLDGAAGVIVLEALPGSGIAVSKLSLAGESLSHPPDECRVDVVGNGPIA